MINILSKDVYNKISAGEVIDGPDSVVKELFENAVDAGGTEISVSIERGGMDKIFVMDNGCGMDRDDLPRAFLPHATSKLKTADDLNRIETLGFRGEALASIAAVSKCTISSKTMEAPIGYKISCEGGSLTAITETPCLEGTAVTVSDIFYNTPARLKFLKTEKSEENAVKSLMEKLILSNPCVAVKFRVGDKLVYESFGEGFKDAVMTVYGIDTVNNCYEISVNKNGIIIEGFIGNTNFFKGNQSYQTLIVNGRWVKDKTIASAMQNAYSSYMMKRQYPFYVLSVSMPGEFVDVNVHPRKTEVRFQDNQIVYSSVYSVVSQVLDGAASALDIIVSKPKAANVSDDILSSEGIISTPRDNLDFGPDEEHLNKIQRAVLGYDIPSRDEPDPFLTEKRVMKKSPLSKFSSTKLSENIFSYPVKDFTSSAEIDEIFKENKQYIEKLEREKQDGGVQSSVKIDAPVKVIGQALDTFLILECDDSVILVDQHAAHERILYDKLIYKVKTNEVVKQTLLIPYAFRVNADEADLLFDRISYFREIGIDLEASDDTSFKVYSIPVDLIDIDLNLFFADILNDAKFQDDKIPSILREKLAQKACKAAIKSGDKLSRSEIDGLLSMLKQDWGLKCPHGRPVCVRISRSEIDKWFKRIV